MSGVSTQDRNRLRWRCRRGTQELDILLMRFFDQHFDSLDAAQRADFERLLAEQDPELQDWLFGRAAPCDDAFIQLIEQIRNTTAP